MKNLLEIELYVYDILVFGKILHQDESLRCEVTDDFEKLIIKTDDFKVISMNLPSLNMNSFFIRGAYKSKDNDTFYKIFDNNKQALEYAEKLNKAVNIINKEGFENSRKTLIKIM